MLAASRLVGEDVELPEWAWTVHGAALHGIWSGATAGAEGGSVPGRDGARSGRDGGLTAAGGDFIQLVVDYAKQETLGPLKGLGRFLAFGVAGSVALSAGGVFLLLAVLRALQSETGSTFTGHLSWLPYLITAVLAVAVMGLAALRITKGPAAKSGRDRHDGRR
ncbi:MAG: hypothetical protein ABSG81_11080 [Acidimicrobiales bacterium]|jgi:hypothetical protein